MNVQGSIIVSVLGLRELKGNNSNHAKTEIFDQNFVYSTPMGSSLNEIKIMQHLT